MELTRLKIIVCPYATPFISLTVYVHCTVYLYITLYGFVWCVKAQTTKATVWKSKHAV